MPAYDYRCTSCDTIFEIARSSTDSSAVFCPECTGDTKRVFTPVGVHFKGSGFYSTDSRPSSTALSGGAEKSKEPAPQAGSCPASGESSGCAGCPASSS